VTTVVLADGTRIGLRPARAGEQSTIYGLVLQNNLNPFGVDWRNFTVAVDDDDRLVGCGQIKQHGDVEELASLVVRNEWQGRGVSSVLMHALLSRRRMPLWLMCESPLTTLYTRYGFVEVGEVTRLPAFFQSMHAFTRYALGLVFLVRGTYVAFMVLDDKAPDDTPVSSGT